MAELKSKDDLPEEILIALEELEKLSQDPNMRMEALNKEMWIRDQMVLINMAKNAEIDGYANGFAKGEVEGIEKGKVEGIEIGKAEGKAEGDRLAKIQIVKKMKVLGLSGDVIVEATGLTKNEIDTM